MPDEFGRYQLIELIGRGGMGEVYRARDTVHDRVVALKVLPDYLAGDESFESRFRRESRMVARLSEPHIIPIHDFGEIDGRLFLDMRLVEGHDLGSVLRSAGPLPVGVAVELCAQVASALDAAHAAGLVHRDVKPSNILLTGPADDPGTVPFAYLVDFGIARSASSDGTALTATTATVGTVAYMSPERISGSVGDLRTDVYALACVLHETLTGRKPFEGELFAQMYAHLHTPPPEASGRRADVPPELDAVIARGMAKDPDQRFPGAGALAAAARAALRDAVQAGTVRARVLDVAPPVEGLHGPAAAAPPGTPPPAAPYVTPPSAPYVTTPSSPHATPPSSPHATPPFPAYAPDGGAGFPPWTPPPPSRPSTPPPADPTQRTGPAQPAGSPGASRRPGHPRRTAVIAAAAVLVVAVGALVAVVAARGGGHPSAGGSGSGTVASRGSTSAPRSSGVAAGPALRTGTASTPAVSWQHFAAFSRLLGTRDHDPGAAFNRGSCALAAPGSADRTLGIRDEVSCIYPGSTQLTTVARYGTAAQLQNYLEQRVASGFRELVWTSAGQPRGLTVISPRTGAGSSSLSTSICGLPSYLVQVSAPDRSKVGTNDLHDDTWDRATFPDAVPPACDTTLRAARSAAVTAPSVGPAKDVLRLDPTVIASLVQHSGSGLTVVQVSTSTGVEAIAVGQQGTVTFWSEVGDVLQRVGRSSYPHSASLGPPSADATGAVLTGMTDPTFVVRGTFSGDGSGNAVAFTNGSKGWGAIKAVADGSLQPSGQGVGIGGIGLGDDFALVGGRLQTFDCSSKLPVAQCGGNDRVIKYWTWRTDRFVQTGSAGRTS